MNDYQVFISYRRDGGDALAGRLADRLRALGYNVFYDVESMRSGKFNTQILDAIDKCEDVLLVLPPNALDRCIEPDDWVRQEIAFALKQKKNVIPIMMRNFEFPVQLPADIDEVRYMEGVEASSAYFDAVIDRIVGLLDSRSIHANENTKYPVVEDTDFSEQDIQILIREKLGVNIDKVNSLEFETSMRQCAVKNGTYPLSGRYPLHRIQLGTEEYDIYDVFYMEGEKYAYGLMANKKYTEQQIGVFFSIDESDNIRPILIGTPDMFLTVDNAGLFGWYAKFRRGLGFVPAPYNRQVIEQNLAIGGIDKLKDISSFAGVDISSFEKMTQEKSCNILEKTNMNLLYPDLEGTYKGKKVYLCDYFGNFYDNPVPMFGDSPIQSPLRKKIILDVVPTKMKGYYVALAYSQSWRKRKKWRYDSRIKNYLLEGPEYYLISSDEDELNIERIKDDNVGLYCEKYLERFALIYMQTKLLLMDVFLK